MSLTALRHVVTVSVTPGAFAQIKLAATPPVLVLTLRDIVLAIDRCRGAHTLVVRTADGTHWASVEQHHFMNLARNALGMQHSNVMPQLNRLVLLLGNTRLASVTLQLPAVTARPEPPVSLPALRQWAAPHPYAFSSKLFWPSPSVGPLETDVFGSQELAAIAEACRRADAPADQLRIFGPPAKLHSILARSPFLPLLLAALANARVRARWVTARMVVGSQSMWAYVLHTLLLRCVDTYWPNDAVAARGIAGIPGLSVQPLPAPRLFCMHTPSAPQASEEQRQVVRYESTLDGTISLPPSDPLVAVNPMALDVTFPLVVRLTPEQPWVRLESRAMAVAASRTATGLPSQVVHDRAHNQWFAVAECALDEFIDAHAPGSLQVPIESARLCRRLAFYRETEPLPVGAAVLASRVWPVGSQPPLVDGVRFSLVDLAPGEYVDRRERLDADRVPRQWWPLVHSSMLIHPLRSAPESACVRANGHWWRCTQQGPSVCLDPQPRIEDLRTVLGFAVRHSVPSTAAPTGVFLCNPPALAALPQPVPRWYRCRLGCNACSVSHAVAHSGDSAVLTRQELACVLWWHWQRFAEFILCTSERADQLGPRWFQLECWALRDALARGAAVSRPVEASPPSPPINKSLTASMDSTVQPVAWRGSSVLLRDNTQWDVNRVVVAAAGTQLEPLEAQIIYLLWCIDDASAQEYQSWLRVGMQLYRLDPDSDTLRIAWQWWSRKYGGDKYNEDKDFGENRRKWDQLGSANGRGGGENLARCMLSLASMAKKAAGGTLSYPRDRVDRALREFWADGRAWWGQ